MKLTKLYVIEARNPDGSLDFASPQPEQIFGGAAVTGITVDRMAKVIYARKPDAVLTGDSVCKWPALLDSRFTARVKYW